MTWTKLDEDFVDHPKVATAGPLGGWLHVCALVYCNRYLTDGFIPTAQVSRLADFSGISRLTGQVLGDNRHPIADFGSEVEAQDVAEELVIIGIWEHTEGGYQIHDYHDYQPSREQVLAERAKKQAAGRAGGKASAQARGEPDDQAESKQSASTSIYKGISTRSSTRLSKSSGTSLVLGEDEANAQAPAQAKSKPDTEPDSVSVSPTTTVVVFGEVFKILADRAFEANRSPIRNRDGWLSGVAQKKMEQYGKQLSLLVPQHPDWTAEQFATALEKPIVDPVEATAQAERERHELADAREKNPCLECQGNGWVPYDDDNMERCEMCNGTGVRHSVAS